MGKNKTEGSPSEFTDMFSKLGFDSPEDGNKSTNLDDDIFDKPGVEEIEDKPATAEVKDGNEQKSDDTDKNDTVAHDDDSEIPDNLIEEKNDNKSQDDKETSEEDSLNDEDNLDKDEEDIDPQEASQVGAFFDAFADTLGWDVDDENKPDTIEGLIDYIKDLVDENSKPDYANDQIKQLDEYVKNGGNFTDFYNNMSQTISYDKLDIDDESNQRSAVRDYLKLSGYTDDQINKKIERYEDADMLREEAEDAVVQLKQIKQSQLEQQQAEQEKLRVQQEESNMKVYQNITNDIKSLDSIYGIKVPQNDRKALMDYILKTDADGHSQYEKDYQKNFTKNLIESAYFTMKGETLFTEAKRSGETSAAAKLRQKLRHTSKNHSTYNADEEKQTQAWDIASKYL